MQNASKKYFPHNWLGLKGLSRLYTVLFYATFLFALYSAWNWLATFWMDPAELQLHSAPLRRLYGFAAIQAGLVCLAWGVFARSCQVLHQTENTLLSARK